MIAQRCPVRLLALVVAALLLGSVLLSAQTVTGTLSGRVTDTGKLVLPGVTVTVSSAQLIGGAQMRVTSETGDFRFPAMPPGTYVIEFELAGFQRLRRQDVVLGAGATAAVDVTLEVASVTETVTVTAGSTMVDVRSSQLRQTATKELIETAPVGRSFTEVLKLMPGVVDGNYNVATTGTNSVHGGSVRNNVFSIDGVNVNDPVVAYPGTDLNLETIAEMQITTAGMSSEFGGASGAVFNVITKSGGNKLSGQASAYYRDKSLQSTNVTDELRKAGIKVGTQLTKAGDYSASLGGPIARDRIWYFGNYQKLLEDQTMINYPPLIQANQNAYFVKGTAQISKKNRVDVLYQYRRRYDEPFQPVVTEQVPEVLRQHRQSNHTTSAKWTGTLSDTTFVEARGSIANQRRYTDFPNAGPNDYGYQDSSTGFKWGGWFRELARPGYRNTRQVKADVSHFASRWGPGSHEIKTGVSYEWLKNSEYREWLAGARLHIMFNGKPDRIQLSNAPVNQNAGVNQWAVYVQDQWIVNGHLTVNGGLRLESAEGWYPAGSSGGVNVPKRDFEAQRDVLTLGNLAPRVGLAYDLVGDHKTVLRASFGRFYNQVYTSEFDAAVPFAFGSKVYSWSDPNGDMVYQAGEEGALISDSTVPAIGRIDPNVKQSYTDSYTVGAGHELGTNLVVGATFIMKKEFDMAEQVSAELPFDQAYNPATLTNQVTGDPITVYALKTSYRGLPTQRFYTNPGTGYCAFCPDLERKYRAIELTAQKRLKDKWQVSASYVYSRSEGNKGTGHNQSQGSVFANPNNLVNAYGRLTLDRPHQFKLQGSYELPYGILVSTAFSMQSGDAWARQIRFVKADSPLMVVESSITVNAEPNGSQRLDTQRLLNLRGEKRFGVAKGRLSIIADVFNVMNANTVTSLQQVRVDHADYGKPGSILLPRTLRLGVRFDF